MIDPDDQLMDGVSGGLTVPGELCSSLLGWFCRVMDLALLERAICEQGIDIICPAK